MPSYVSASSARRGFVYEHHAAVLSHAIEQKRGLFAQAAKHVID
jgi:hypothetical protein